MLPSPPRSIGMRTLRTSFAAAVFGAAWLTSLPVANSQDQTQSNTPDSASSPSAPEQNPIPDQKLGAAAAAMEQVASLRQTYQHQIAKASESDKPRLASEASQALTKAVTDQGLSVDEYNSIMQAAQSNPTVRDGLIQHLHPTGPVSRPWMPDNSQIGGII
jgi:hypothetical protein